MDGEGRFCLVAFDESGEDFLSRCTPPTTIAEFARGAFTGAAAQQTRTLSLTLDEPADVALVSGDDMVLRLAGDNRVATALQVVRSGWDSADTVLLGSTGSFADALAAAPVAGSLDAPLMLTDTDALPAGVLEEVTRLGATQVVLLGGESAIGSVAGGTGGGRSGWPSSWAARPP